MYVIIFIYYWDGNHSSAEAAIAWAEVSGWAKGQEVSPPAAIWGLLTAHDAQRADHAC